MKGDASPYDVVEHYHYGRDYRDDAAGYREVVREFSHQHWPLAQQFQHPSAHWISEGFEPVIHGVDV